MSALSAEESVAEERSDDGEGAGAGEGQSDDDQSDFDRSDDLESAIRAKYRQLSEGFTNLDTLEDADKTSALKALTNIMQECKRLIKEFERDARVDQQMPPKVLSEKKRQLVQELNTYISIKKTTAAQLQARNNLIGQQGNLHQDRKELEKMSAVELMELGQQRIEETDLALEHARILVEDTVQIGAATAAIMNDQTKQMEGVLNDLDDITFNMKKAQKVIAEITRGFASDKFCLCLLFFVIVSGCTSLVIYIQVADPVGSNNVPEVAPTPTPLPEVELPSSTPARVTPLVNETAPDPVTPEASPSPEDPATTGSGSVAPTTGDGEPAPATDGGQTNAESTNGRRLLGTKRPPKISSSRSQDGATLLNPG